MKIIIFIITLFFVFSCSKNIDTNINDNLDINENIQENTDVSQEDIDKITKEFEDALNDLFKIEEQNSAIDNKEIEKNTNEIQDTLSEIN